VFVSRQALLSSAKQKPSQKTLESINKLSTTLVGAHPEQHEQALPVFLWHLQEISLPPVSPAGISRFPTVEEWICLTCLREAILCAIDNRGSPSVADLTTNALHTIWLWVGYFVEVFVLGIPNQGWRTTCCTTIFTSFSMLEKDHLIIAQSAQVTLAFWLAMSKDPSLRKTVKSIIDPTQLGDGIQPPMRVSDLIISVYVESDEPRPPAQEQRFWETRAVFESVNVEIIPVAFRDLDRLRLEEVTMRSSPRVSREVFQTISLVTTLHQDYSFVFRRPELFSAANLHSVMRVFSWITERPPACWTSSHRGVSANLSRIVQHCLLYIEAVFFDDRAYPNAIQLIHKGLPAALFRARSWLRKEWDIPLVASYTLEEKIETLQLDILGHMWLMPVYAALDEQLASGPPDMDPRIRARLRRWTPAKTHFRQYANNALMPPLWGPPASSLECSYSKVRGRSATCAPYSCPRSVRADTLRTAAVARDAQDAAAHITVIANVNQVRGRPLATITERSACLSFFAAKVRHLVRTRSVSIHTYLDMLHPGSHHTTEFARRVAECELSVFHRAGIQQSDRVIPKGHIFEIELRDDREPRVTIGALDEKDDEPMKRELWGDVFAEVEHDGYMLVRILFLELGVQAPRAAFCSVPIPEWIRLGT
jgi:hypothetical protein